MKIRPLRIELLERRVVLASAMGEALHVSAHEQTDVEYFPMIVASGENYGDTPDTPTSRETGDYDAVGSLSMRGRTGSYICTGTLINDPVTHGGDELTGSDWVLTAGHCLDSNNNGRLNFKPKDVTFYPDGNTNNGLVAESLFLHPEFDGFGRGGSVSNDIALIKLKNPAPELIEPHHFHEVEVGAGWASEFRMVGFGLTGDGDNGYDYDLGTDFSIKREGGNHPDDRGEGPRNSLNNDKIWRADFDHPDDIGNEVDPSYNLIGANGVQLPYNVEANLGGGDSGGPSFLVDSNGDVGGIAAINTFGYSSYLNASPLFGSGMGGILVYKYLDWINDVMTGGSGGGDGGGGGGGGDKPCNPKKPGCSLASLGAQISLTSVGDVATAPANSLDRLNSEVDTLGIGPIEGQSEALLIVATADTGRGNRTSVTSLDFASESTVSLDRVLEDWPSSLQSSFDGELLLR